MENREKRKKISSHERNRGVISVFLTIILVPCMVFTCAFGDLSRVMLSRAEAESASDLALYSLLAHYDADLQEYYGLVASCQTISEFYQTSEEYFTAMMRAEGMSDASANMISNYIHALESGNASDMLQVEFSTPAKVEAAKDSALGSNPALIEDGIVEFMKYRGPIELVENLITRFKDLDLSGKVNDVSEDEKIVEAKQDYAEAEGELLKEALYSYIAIRQYADSQQSTWISALTEKSGYRTDYQSIQEDLNNIRDDFAKVTDLITKYYTEYTDGIYQVDFPLKNSLSAPTYTSQDLGQETVIDGATRYVMTEQQLTDLESDLSECISAITDAQSNLMTAVQSIPSPMGTEGENINPAIYCMWVQEAVGSSSSLSSMRSEGNKLMDIYNQLETAKRCDPNPPADGPATPNEWSQKIDELQDNINTTLNDYFSTASNTSYSQFIKAYYSVANDAVSRVKERNYQFSSEYMDGVVSIGTFMKQVRTNFGKLDSELEQRISQLNIAIAGGTITVNGQTHEVTSLDHLKELIITYQENRDTWGNVAAQGSSEYAESERAEYEAEIDDDAANKSAMLAKKLCELGPEAVEELKQRLTSIRDDMISLRAELDAFTYGGAKVITLEGREAMVTASRTVINITQKSEISIYLSENASAAQSYYPQLISPQSGTNVTSVPALNSGKDGNDPDLGNNPPELYSFMVERFLPSEIEDLEEKIKENDAQNDTYKADADKDAEEAKGVSNKYLYGLGKDLESCSNSGNVLNAITAVQGIVESVNNILNGHGDELRDELYVVEYAMDMFSYSSFNTQGQYILGGKTYTLKDLSEEGKYPNYDTWATEDPTKNHEPLFRNEYLTLTNYPICNTYDRANLAEIEYILYGNTDIKADLTKAYESVYAIRLALNTVSGFQNFYHKTNSTASVIQVIAATIMAATAGVVPVAVTKCVLIGVLAIMESARDLSELKGGLPVIFYKSTHEAWYYKITANGTAAKFGGEDNDARRKNGLYYSDYMYIFMMAAAANQETYEAMLLRIGDLIEANMRLRGSNTEYDLDKAICYFTLSAKIRVKPLMLTLPIVDSVVGESTADSVRNGTDWCTYDIGVVRGYS